MNFRDFFIKVLGKTGGKTSKNIRFSQPLFSNTNSDQVVYEETLKTLPDIVSAIRLIADDVSKTKLVTNVVEYDNKNGNKSVKQNKINGYTKLFERNINESQTVKKFLKMYIHHIFEKGRFIAFIHKKAGVVQEIIPLDPELVSIASLGNGKRIFVMGTDENNKIYIEDKDIIFIPWEEAIGYEDVEFRVQFQLMLCMFADLYELDSSLLSNKANFMAHIKVPEDLGTGDTSAEDQLEQIRMQYQNMVENSRKNGAGVIVTDAKWELAQINKTSNDKKSTLDSESQKDMMRKIARAFKIPMSYLGYQEDSTTDATQTKITYLEQAIQPWIETLVEELNYKLFGNDTTKEITYDFSASLKVSVKTLAEAVSILSNSGTITINELRTKYLGLPTIIGGDMIMGNSTLIPVMDQSKKIKAEIKTIEKNNKTKTPIEKGGSKDG